MKSYGSAASWVVVLMAASSLFSMIAMLNIDYIVHHTLYNFGLRFSYAWAEPYWNLTGFVFAMGWLNIIAAIGVHLYSLAFKRKEVEQLVTEVEKEIKETDKTTPIAKVEEQKEQEAKLIETAQKQTIEISTLIGGSETQEKMEEKPALTEYTQIPIETELKQPEKVEEQNEEEPMRPTESKTEQGKHKETIPRPWLGASGIDMTSETAIAMDTNVTHGWLITEVVSGGPADSAGLRAGSQQVQIGRNWVTIGGDIITALNGTRIANMSDLLTYLEEHTLVGQIINVTISRSNQAMNLTVKLGTRPK